MNAILCPKTCEKHETCDMRHVTCVSIDLGWCFILYVLQDKETVHNGGWGGCSGGLTLSHSYKGDSCQSPLYLLPVCYFKGSYDICPRLWPFRCHQATVTVVVNWYTWHYVELPLVVKFTSKNHLPILQVIEFFCAVDINCIERL